MAQNKTMPFVGKLTTTSMLLIATVVLGIILRVVFTGQGPGGLNRDEAALAYNSYLLAFTGNDEWGRAFPIALESFGDYKLVGYPLLLIPLLKVVGIEHATDLLVRLPSILAGVALIPLSYFFALRFKLRKTTALVFSFLVATTPIFIFYSRFAYEANVALALFVASFLCLSTLSKRYYQLLGFILFYAAVCTYNTPLLLAPSLMLLILTSVGFKSWRKILLPVVGVVIISLLFLFQTQDLLAQKKGITIFDDATVTSLYPEYRSSFSGPWQQVLGNSKVYYGTIVANNFLASLSPKFLALQGGAHPWHSLSGYGHVFIPQYVLVVLGSIVLIVVSIVSIFRVIPHAATAQARRLVPLFVILILSLLPAAVTVDAPHATRSLFPILLLLLLGVAGFEVLFILLSPRAPRQASSYKLPLIILLVSIQLFLSAQFVYRLSTSHQAQTETTIFPGLSSFLDAAYQDSSEFPITVLDTSGYLYILFAWYGKIPAHTFLETVERLDKDTIGFSYGSKVGPYRFVSKPEDANDGYVYFSDGRWRHHE